MQESKVLENTYQCIGCGALIQTTEPEGFGYLPKSALLKGLEAEAFYCQRCFRLRHYNELKDLKLDDDKFLEILHEISDDKALIINVIDLFDFEGSMISGLHRFVMGLPYIVFVNKFDLLPKGTRKGRSLHWVKQALHRNGLRPDEIIIGSAKQPDTLEPLYEQIEKYIRERNIYIVGVTNVGKSTLLNRLLTHYGAEGEIITTSAYPGTTLDLIKLPLNDPYSLIDTPGIIRRSQLAHYLDSDTLHKVLPKKEIKPIVYQLNPGQTIFIESLARIDFTKGSNKTSFTFYVSNEVKLHRTKLEKADDFYSRHKDEYLQAKKNPNFEARQFKVDKNQELAISGLGWVKVNEACNVTVHTPEGVGVYVRDSLI